MGSSGCGQHGPKEAKPGRAGGGPGQHAPWAGRGRAGDLVISRPQEPGTKLVAPQRDGPPPFLGRKVERGLGQDVPLHLQRRPQGGARGTPGGRCGPRSVEAAWPGPPNSLPAPAWAGPPFGHTGAPSEVAARLRGAVEREWAPSVRAQRCLWFRVVRPRSVGDPGRWQAQAGLCALSLCVWYLCAFPWRPCSLLA